MKSRLDRARKELMDGNTDAAAAEMDTTEAAARMFELLLTLEAAIANRDDDAAKSARLKIAEAREKLRVGKAGKPDLDEAAQRYHEASGLILPKPADAAARRWGVDAEAIVPRYLEPEPADGRSSWAAREETQRRLLKTLLVLRKVVRGVLVALALVTGMVALYVAPSAGFIGNTFADAAALLFWGFGSGWVDKVFIDWG